jgi:hypothetical protein
MKTTIPITHFLDEDGTPCVSVPLTNDQNSVVLYQEDFNLLISLGLDPRWRVGQGQIFETGRSKISIPRLIVDAQGGDKIEYLDRNFLNLKRSNLTYAKGGGKHKTREKITKMNRPKTKGTIEMEHIHQLPSWENQ